MNAQQLKNAILQEAIEGRLVPQDPNDEPASVLLERIRKEKERLYKDGLLKKKEITDREINENEVPFSLPNGWTWTKIDNVAFVTKLAGFEYTKFIADNLVSKENGIPLFKGKNVQNGRIVYEFEAYIPIELSNELRRSQVKKKCLLTPYVGTIGNIGIHNKVGVYHLGSNVGKIEFYNGDSLNILEEYAKYYLMSSYGYDELTKYKKATAQESISIEAIRDVFIPLPPIAEQHRIVAKIEELLPKVEEYGKAQDALNKLNAELPERIKKSILQEAIEGRLVPQDPNDEPASVLLAKICKEKEQLVKEGKLKKKDLEVKPISEDEIPFDIPESWEWVRINTVMNILDSQRKPVSKSDRVAGVYPYCGANGILDYVKHYIFDGSFVLVGEDGSVVTKAGNPVVNRIEGKIWVNNHAHVLQEYGNLGYQDYIFYCLQGTDITKYVHGFMPKYSQSDLRDTLIPFPPLAEQHRIVEKLEQLLGEIDKLKV